MTRSLPKAHTISQEDSAYLAFPAFLALVVLTSILVLGLLGESEREAQAGNGPSRTADERGELIVRES